MTRFNKVLIPTDFSDPSREAARVGVGLVAEGGTVILCHVVDDTPLTYGYVGVTLSQPELQSRLAREAENELETFSVPETPSGVRVERRILHGNPFVSLVQFAREENVDLIVIGTHGRTGLRHILIGSVAEKVVRKAYCPVLVVRPAGTEFVHP